MIKHPDNLKTMQGKRAWLERELSIPRRKRPPGPPDAPHAGAGYEGIKEETLTTTYLSYNHDDYKLNSQKIALYRWCVQKGRLSDGREILRQLVNRTARIQL